MNQMSRSKNDRSTGSGLELLKGKTLKGLVPDLRQI